jgi:glycosyltransferase involved in cell wall biosynthesis
LFITREPPFPNHFKQVDYDILSERYATDWFPFNYSPLTLLRLFFRMRRYDLAFCWFANVWAFLAVLFAKLWGTRTIVVAGGVDIASVPEKNYGLRQWWLLKRMARFALNRADSVLSVSHSAEAELAACARPRRTRMIYCCIRCPALPAGQVKKRQVLTVGLVNGSSSNRKGHFAFIELARRVPDVPFVLFGRQQDDVIEELRRLAPANVQFLNDTHCDERGEAELMRLLSVSKVYVQLSTHEGFGVSVVESMWHGCWPVVSDRGSLPEVVGAAGAVVPLEDLELAARKVREALDQPADLNAPAMERAREFVYERRRDDLLAEVQAVLSSRSDRGLGTGD